MELSNLRLGFACKERWDDMVGDDRVRACGACDKQVFNLSSMTRAQAEALLATRGIKPCVRFYRRPDGTVMTSDCPSGVPRRSPRLAVIAAGATLAASPAALADDAAPTMADDAVPREVGPEEPIVIQDETRSVIQAEVLMGIPMTYSEEVGIMIIEPEARPAVEWSLWTRVGVGITTQPADVAARRVTVTEPPPTSATTFDAAIAVDVTLGVARHGDLRVGAWGEVRTSSEPVAGGELVLEGLPPHPYDSRIGRTGSVVLRAGGNSRVITGALGFGYVGSFPRWNPWIKWARHVVGARAVLSVNRALDVPSDWSVTLGLEIEPLGALHAAFNYMTR